MLQSSIFWCRGTHMFWGHSRIKSNLVEAYIHVCIEIYVYIYICIHIGVCIWMHAMFKAVYKGVTTWLGLWLVAVQIFTYLCVGVGVAAITWRQQRCQLQDIGTCLRAVGVTIVPLCYEASYLGVEQQTCSGGTHVKNKTWLKHTYMCI